MYLDPFLNNAYNCKLKEDPRRLTLEIPMAAYICGLIKIQEN